MNTSDSGELGVVKGDGEELPFITIGRSSKRRLALARILNYKRHEIRRRDPRRLQHCTLQKLKLDLISSTVGTRAGHARIFEKLDAAGPGLCIVDVGSRLYLDGRMCAPIWNMQSTERDLV